LNIWLEWDSVTIAPDLHTSTLKALRTLSRDKHNEEALAELRLYYVATSRAKFELEGADLLD